MKNIKPIFIFMTILGLQYANLPILQVYAQQATDSAQIASQSAVVIASPEAKLIDPTLTSTPQNPFSEFNKVPGELSQSEIVNQSLSQSLVTPPAQVSATVRQGKVVYGISKHTFKRTESVELSVSNATAQEISIDVLNNKGEKVKDILVEKVTNGNEVMVTLLPPVQTFIPGTYTIRISDTTGVLAEQNFAWGVLAINPDKSVYLAGDIAYIGMAVLDENGNMVCDADVNLQVTSPSGKITTLQTPDGVKVTSQCTSHEVSNIPDYEATYKVQELGDYTLNLTSKTKNGTYSIKDKFSVQNSVQFVLERHAPTRIYPINSYPVTFDITSEQDFNGTIHEYVPAGFSIASLPGSDISFTQQQTNVHGADTLSAGYLRMPFDGSYPETQGFGDHLSDPKERDLYAQYGLAGHDGLDFALPMNTPVVAVDGGKVILAGNGAYGQTVVIQHAWGRSYYGHLNKISVVIGELVGRGDNIGFSGNTGLSTKPHLHFGIRPNNSTMTNGYYGKIDPTAYLAFPHKNTRILASTNSLNGDWKEITWQVNMKKGQHITLGYIFKSPPQSPQFYTLGPLQFFSSDKTFTFGEIRQWEIASDATNTYYMTSTAGSSPYPTTSWTYATAANASSNVTTFAENKKTAGLYQFQPGATNTTSLGSTASSLPTTVTNKGWIYTGTNLDGLQTDAGTWTINYKYSVTYTTTAPTTKNLWYRVLKVTCSAGSCSSGAVISPTDASAPASSGWSKTAIGTVPSSGVLSAAQNLTFSGALTQFASGDKLYVEFAIETNSTNNNSGGWKIEANTSSDNIVTSNVSTPPPVLNQVHYRWRNDDGSETAATWRANEDSSSNKSQNTNIRLRVEISNSTGGSTATGTTYRVEYGTLSTTCSAISTWTAVPTTATTEAFQMVDSTYLTDGNVTTNVSSGLTDVGSNFVSGQVKDTSDQTTGITLATTDFTEIEYSIQPTNNSSVGTTYCFRLTNAGNTTNFSYTQYPQLVVGQPVMNQEHYRWRNDDGPETTTTGNILYFSPTSDLSTAVFTPTGCTGHYDCLNDNAGNAASSGSAPTNDGATTTLAMAAGTERYTLDLSSLPTGYTITAMTISAYASDTGNPNTNVTLGYCLTACNGTDDTMAASAHNINNAAYTQYSDTFSSLSITGSVGLVMTADSAKASVSTLYVAITYTAPGASWKAAEDTTVTNQAVSQNVRLRIEVANTGSIQGNRNFTIQYAAKNSTCAVSSYADVPVTATTEPFEMVTSSYFANHDATTTQLTATGSFTPGEMIEDPSNTTNSVTISGTTYTEVEYDLLVTTNAVGSYCLRLDDSSLGVLDTYSQYAEIYIPPVPTLSQLMRHGQWFYNGVVQPFTF